MQKTHVVIRKKQGRDKLGDLDWHIYSTTYKTDNIKVCCTYTILYSTENSTQYSVMTYMGKESEKEWIYVYI